jgi:DNA-binding response OmpR family regulator
MDKKRILILEDDEIIQILYTKVLTDYHVTIVDNIADAIAMSETCEYDLYIVDLMFREEIGSGMDFIKTGISPYIIVSAVQLLPNNLENKIDYIRKPFRNKELLEKIKELS